MSPVPQTPTRQGAAVVEFAICLPVIVFLVFVAIDITNLLCGRQRVVEALHETARVVATNDLSEAQARQFAIDLLRQEGLSNATITFHPAPSAGLRRGTPISVSLTIPIDGNCTMVSHLFLSLSLSARATVSREIGDLRVSISDKDNDDDN
jgi:hypothetical protein